MAYQRITPVLLSPDGTSPSTATTDAVNGNVVTNAASLALDFTNGTASDVTITFITSATVQGYAVADLEKTITAGASLRFAHFPTAAFGAELAFTTSAAITVGVYR